MNIDNSNNNSLLLIGSWFNAAMGTIFNQPVLSNVAYISSIIGSIVYIYTTYKKYKNEKTN
jgi:hypothetical protein